MAQLEKMESGELELTGNCKFYTMGAQITILKGNASIPPSIAVTQRSLPNCSLANYVLPPCTVNSCLCTSCAAGAQASASLCSEHELRRHTAVGDNSSGRSYVTKQWHYVPLLRTRALLVYQLNIQFLYCMMT